MLSDHRQNTIINYLKVKPSSHGQLDIELLVIPELDKVKNDISPDERKLIEETFKEQGTNLIPIIVRRIEPDEEDREYEVVYGQKWCIIAEEMGIDRLWTWVFDLEEDQKEDQIPLIQEKMAALAGSEVIKQIQTPKEDNQSQFNKVIKQLQKNQDQLIKRIEQLEEIYQKNIEALQTKLDDINSKLSSSTPPISAHVDDQTIVNAFNEWEESKLTNKLGSLRIIGQVGSTNLEKVIRSIITERQKQKFSSLLDLNRVTKLGPKTIDKIKQNWN